MTSNDVHLYHVGCGKWVLLSNVMFIAKPEETVISVPFISVVDVGQTSDANLLPAE